MTEHDWWSHLSPFEKSRIRSEEREAERKENELAALRLRPKARKSKAKLELEIAGHRFYRQQLVNRGTQRAKLGIAAKMTRRERRRVRPGNRTAA